MFYFISLFIVSGLVATPAAASCNKYLGGQGPGVVHSFGGAIGNVTALAVHPKTETVAVAYFDRLTKKSKIKIFDSNGKLKFEIDPLAASGRERAVSYKITALAFYPQPGPNSESLVVGDSRNGLFMVDAKSSGDSTEIYKARSLAELISTGDAARSIQFISAKEAIVTGNRGSVYKLTFEENGNTLATKRTVLSKPEFLDYPMLTSLVVPGRYYLFASTQWPAYISVYSKKLTQSKPTLVRNDSRFGDSDSFKTSIDQINSREIAIAESKSGGGARADGTYPPRTTWVNIYDSTVDSLAGDKVWPKNWQFEVPSEEFWIQRVIQSKDGSKLLFLGLNRGRDTKECEECLFPAIRLMVVDRNSKRILKDWLQFEKADQENYGPDRTFFIGYLPTYPVAQSSSGRYLWIPGFSKLKPTSALEVSNEVYKVDVDALFEFAIE